MTQDEALTIVVPLSAEDRKVLLETLIMEMRTSDADEVLAKNGYVSDPDA